MLWDMHLGNGNRMPLARLGMLGYDYVVGIEVEYYVVALGQARLDPEGSGTHSARGVCEQLPGHGLFPGLRPDSAGRGTRRPAGPRPWPAPGRSA